MSITRPFHSGYFATLTALYPLVTILLAMLLLKDRLNRIQLGGVLLSLFAIYLFNVQREEGFLSRWLAYAIVPIILWGAAGFLQKRSTPFGKASSLRRAGIYGPKFTEICLLSTQRQDRMPG